MSKKYKLDLIFATPTSHHTSYGFLILDSNDALTGQYSITALDLVSKHTDFSINGNVINDKNLVLCVSSIFILDNIVDKYFCVPYDIEDAGILDNDGFNDSHGIHVGTDDSDL